MTREDRAARVAAIRERLLAGVSLNVVAREFGTSGAHISLIATQNGFPIRAMRAAAKAARGEAVGLVFGGAHRPSGRLSRFVSGPHRRPDQVGATLSPDHPAILGATTLFPRSVRTAPNSPRLLVSGHNSPKLGAAVVKGAWAGMPIFHLTLIERETCPRSCELWRQCFGNAMPLTRRHRYDGDMMPALARELSVLQVEHPNGFVVRLHGLGDFPDVAYTSRWLRWLCDFSALRVFGYTHHPRASRIGRMIAMGNRILPSRWAVRFSGPSDAALSGMQTTTIWRPEAAANVPEGLICPAQQGRTECCGTCGLCWSPATRDQRIVFLGHGMARRGGSSKLARDVAA